jgi:mono/diheme cytochrome c family protein
MNRDFDYGGRRDNQLRTLEHLDIFKFDFSQTAREVLKQTAHADGATWEESEKQAGKLVDTTGQREWPKTSSLLPDAPPMLTHLVNPADDSQSLNLRARSYLHANCAHCHVEAGGGNASVDLDFSTSGERTKMFDIAAQLNLGTPGAKLIAMGKPGESVVLHRIATRGTGQMPPLGSNVVDQQAVKLMEEWIKKMPASTQP